MDPVSVIVVVASSFNLFPPPFLSFTSATNCRRKKNQTHTYIIYTTLLGLCPTLVRQSSRAFDPLFFCAMGRQARGDESTASIANYGRVPFFHASVVGNDSERVLADAVLLTKK